MLPDELELTDGKGRPSWAEDPAIWQMYQRVVARAFSFGVTAQSCGWVLQPSRHGEYRLVGGSIIGLSITVADETPAMAAMAVEVLLDALEAYRGNR